MRMQTPVWASDVTLEPLTFLWEPYFIRKDVALIGGEPDTGKTMLLTALMSAVSTGQQPSNMPGKLIRHGTVLYFGQEDANEGMRQRLDGFDIDLSNIALMEGDFTIEGDNLDKYLKQYRPVLCIFDPLKNYEPDSINSNEEKDARKSIGILRDYAKEYDCCILTVIHPPKNDDYRLQHRFAGSGGYVALARQVYYVGFHPEEPRKRVLMTVKNNVYPGDIDPAIYTLDPNTGFSWSGTDSTITRKDVEKSFKLPTQKNEGDLKKGLALIETLLYRCADEDGLVCGSSGKLVELYKETTGNESPLNAIKLGRLLANRPLRAFLEKNGIEYVAPRTKDGYRVYTFRRDIDYQTP